MAIDRSIRVLVVDDSAVMRSLLRSVVGAVSGLEVAGTAADGASALSALDALRPDLVLLDVEMPEMDGLATLREMRRRGHKLPVIMCSSLTRRGAKETIEALTCGASEYVTKPTGQFGADVAIRALADDLEPKIRALTISPACSAISSTLAAPPAAPEPAGLLPGRSQSWPAFRGVAPAPLPWKLQPMLPAPSVLVIGVSTGGPAALDALLPALPEDFPLPVLIVQHMPELFTKLFAERLNSLCRLQVREAAEGDPVRPGTISIARGNWHMQVAAAARAGATVRLSLNQGPPENHCRPSVDALFRSAADVYGAGVLAVVLTGMGSDGLAGCRLIRAHGGSVLAQDQASSTVWGMPGAVANAGLARKVLPLHLIAPEIRRIAARADSEAGLLRRSAV